MSSAHPIHVVCSVCEAVNRIDTQGLQNNPLCGRCREPLFRGIPEDVGEQRFEKIRLRSELPLLVDFWAEWCGPCKMMAPQLKKAANLLEPSVQIVKVNTETCPQLASDYQIRSIPTLVLIRNGREIGRQSGALGSEDIVRWTRGTLQKP